MTTEEQLVKALSHNQTLSETVDALRTKMSGLAKKLKRETEQSKEMWHLNCAQITGFDDMLTAKEEKVTDQKARIRELETSRGSDAHTLPASMVSSIHLPQSPSTHVPPSGKTSILPTTSSTHSCRGKAPPVSKFTGEEPKCQLVDWLPTLERTCT